MYLMSAEVAAMLSNSERKRELFDALVDMGAVRWLAGQIFRGGVERLMPRN